VVIAIVQPGFYFNGSSVNQCPEGSDSTTQGAITCQCDEGYLSSGSGDSLTCTAIPSPTIEPTPAPSDDCFIENSVEYFEYLGSVQTYTVRPCVFTLVVQAYGAQGGRYEQPGGLGGFIQGSIAVEPPGVVYVYVGQAGYSAGYCNYANGVFNGGGGGNCGGGTGGGASDVRTVQGNLTSRLIVAGGGGGGAYGGGGGCGGGMVACSSRGGGGTQTAGRLSMISLFTHYMISYDMI
jgi:hypothetical protein